MICRMIIYFTGTENSKQVADRLGLLTGDEVVDSRPLMKAGKAGAFQSDRPHVFCCPTYSWQVPLIFRDWIRKSSFEGNHQAYFLLTCGSDTGNALRYVKELCQEKSFAFLGFRTIVMPENYLALFPTPDPQSAQAILERALPVIDEAAMYIQEARPLPAEDKHLFDGLKSSLVHDFFFRFMVKADPFYVTDACIGCGKCARVCVCNNIHLEGDATASKKAQATGTTQTKVGGESKMGSQVSSKAGRQAPRPVWGKNCTHCMACIAGCPVQAIEYGNKTQKRHRYWCHRFFSDQSLGSPDPERLK